jgi:hypothetical protein
MLIAASTDAAQATPTTITMTLVLRTFFVSSSIILFRISFSASLVEGLGEYPLPADDLPLAIPLFGFAEAA